MKKLNQTLLYLLLVFPIGGISQTISNSKHNLSVTGPGTVKSSSESEICIFCHTPHNSNPQVPLWNRDISNQVYTIYDNSISSSFTAISGQPDGASLICLSCHDGTIALGSVVSRTKDIFDGSGGKMPTGSSGYIGTNLTDDHPVSFLYDAGLSSSDGNLKFPPDFPATVDANSKMQCTSCHTAHDDNFGNFLIASTENSNLCLKCHDNSYWPNSRHNKSNTGWNGAGTNPWAHIKAPYPSVAQNGCANCHAPHNAVGKARILKSNLEEKNCVDCHNGNVASKNIEADFNKAYRHNVSGYNALHEPEESITGVNHVECVDCHNPHAANNAAASAPNRSGKLRGVRGINQNGVSVAEINYEYELCYRCHADNSLTSSKTNRQISQENTRLEFELANPSYHPVAGRTKSTSSPSLIAPLSVSSVIYCTDCHSSDNSDINGPHGSIYPTILKLNYSKANNTNESSTAYALCYSCHDRTSILNDNSFKEHDKHIRGENTPCNICHDPHGISSSQGNSTNNSHLINFDLSVVSPDNQGRLRFEDLGNRQGRCYLTCHGENHNPESY